MVEDHFRSLNSIEEPLQRPFATETLNIQADSLDGNAEGPQGVREVLLRDRIEEFRKVREGKERTLCKLWEEWEEVQFELISLAAEVLGQESITFAQTRDKDMKPGQREKLQKALEPIRESHEDTSKRCVSLEADLAQLEASMDRITSNAKKTMTEMQQVSVDTPPQADGALHCLQQYNIQKNKLFQGLQRHIEMLAAL